MLTVGGWHMAHVQFLKKNSLASVQVHRCYNKLVKANGHLGLVGLETFIYSIQFKKMIS